MLACAFIARGPRQQVLWLCFGGGSGLFARFDFAAFKSLTRGLTGWVEVSGGRKGHACKGVAPEVEAPGGGVSGADFGEREAHHEREKGDDGPAPDDGDGTAIAKSVAVETCGKCGGR